MGIDQGIDRTIIVGGASRSGTTLTTAIMDAHPEVSMAFECVPRELEGDLVFYDRLVDTIVSEFGYDAVRVDSPKKVYAKVQKQINQTDRWFGNWVRLCRRSGVDLVGIGKVIEQLRIEGVDRIDANEPRLRAARLVVDLKQEITGKPSVGLKSAAYLPFVDFFPEVYHLVILRDPRDALASWRRLNWRDRPADEHATRWCALYEKYRSNVPTDRLVMIRYNDWASGDQDYAKEVFTKLGLSSEFDTRTYYEATMVKDISGVDITKEDLWRDPLTTARIGYYKDILTPDEISTIESIAGDLMEEFGFLGDAARA